MASTSDVVNIQGKVDSARMAKRVHKPDDLTVRFPPGTLERIALIQKGRERKTDFIRAAVAAKLQRRERPAPVGRASKPSPRG